MDDYLSKPPQAAQLQAMLARYLAHPSEKPTVGFFSHRVKVLVRWRDEPERQAPPNGSPGNFVAFLFRLDVRMALWPFDSWIKTDMFDPTHTPTVFCAGPFADWVNPRDADSFRVSP